MVVTCEIQFDQNPFGTYYAGQLVSGTATLKVDKPKDVKAVLLKVAGYATTRWSEKGFNKRRIYDGREDYMASLTYLLGSEENTKSTIYAGTHQYTFACQLPYNCPSSFEGLFGHIRYVVKVVLIRPWKFDQTYTRGMTVLKTEDLNYDSPQLKVPSHTSNYRSFGCGPCKTDPLKLELSIPHAGFVPGQLIPVNALVINNTNIPISEVIFSLVMQVRYYSNSPLPQSRVEYINISSVKGDSVLRHCTRSLNAEIHVPPTPPTCLNACKIIQIAYQIEVEAKMKSMYGNQLITMPITIGNVPLWNSVVTRQPTSSANGRALTEEVAEEPAANKGEQKLKQSTISNPFARTSPNAVYPDLPPPDYEEAVHVLRGDINEDELHSFGRNEFTPLYPVYHIPQPDSEIEPAEGYVNESYIE